MPLTPAQIAQFVEDGFCALPDAFSPALAAQARDILWRDTGCDPHDPSTWTKPVIRLHDYPDEPFRQAANTPALHTAFDQLVGPGRWLPRTSLGTFPIRFPSPDPENPIDPGDAGWHVDASFDGPDGNWWINVHSRGRALLMLFLFSDIGPDDAPTRIRIGSHRDVALLLAPHGDQGLPFLQLAEQLEQTPDRPVTLATGAAGTVYLCHPFLVHAAQPHRGRAPRFLAQPPLYPAAPLFLDRPDGAYSPVEQAIRQALS